MVVFRNLSYRNLLKRKIWIDEVGDRHSREHSAIGHQPKLCCIYLLGCFRLGLLPVMRRAWTLEGEQPIAQVKHQDKCLWVYGFVHPELAETYWWLLPFVNTQLFNRVLADARS